jgi:YggT family protein
MMMNPVLWLIITILDLYSYVVIAAVVLSWLVAFNVVNGGNPIVRQVWHAVNVLTEPLLAPIRRLLPNLGGIDISPIFLLVALQFLRYSLVPWLAFKIGLL